MQQIWRVKARFLRNTPRLALSVVATAQDGQAKRRLTPKEIEALPSESAGAGTSGLPAVTTRVLFGDPNDVWLVHHRAEGCAEYGHPGAYASGHAHGRRHQWTVAVGGRAQERTGQRANRTSRGRVQKEQPSALPGMGQSDTVYGK